MLTINWFKRDSIPGAPFNLKLLFIVKKKEKLLSTDPARVAVGARQALDPPLSRTLIFLEH